MLRTLPVLILSLSPIPAAAAERSVALIPFERVRVDGPIAVRLNTAGLPGAKVIGDPATLDSVTLKVEGGTLIVRYGTPGRDERRFAAASGAPPAVEIDTSALRSAGVGGGAQLTVAGPVAGERVDLTITGTGTITAPGVAANTLVVTLVGDGQVMIGGTARTARLIANGGGAIAAGDLVANDALIRTEGPVAVTLTGRYTVNASSTGTGPITILGNPECKVRASAVGRIACANATPF